MGWGGKYRLILERLRKRERVCAWVYACMPERAHSPYCKDTFKDILSLVIN